MSLAPRGFVDSRQRFQPTVRKQCTQLHWPSRSRCEAGAIPHDGRSAPIALRFNDAINARDVAALEALMTADHRFVDSEGQVTAGLDASVAAWSGFFETFPDYRNDLEVALCEAEIVVLRGRSHCSVAELDAPALWSARIEGERVAEWRVHDDTLGNRRMLGID